MTEILVGHALDVLRGLEADRFQCVVTSPPYFNLRAYHTEPQVWGGDVGCEHEWAEVHERDERRCSKESYSRLGVWNVTKRGQFTGESCILCGAWKGELGAEPCPETYIEHLLQVFAEVRRVTRPDACVWVNIGDSYSSQGGHGWGTGATAQVAATKVNPESRARYVPGVPAKSLCLIPERLALGLLGQGWIIRNRLAWHKPNAMPTSAQDRFKCCWETVFMLVKQQRYKFRLGAVKEPVVKTAPGTWELPKHDGVGWSSGRNMRKLVLTEDSTANPGDVWRIASQPRSENHFAAFPDDLVKRCLLASTDPGDEVLDPFVGRGTTVIVAKQLGRRAVGIELNPTYAALAEANIRKEASQEVMPT